jgi:hypothetical protein
LNEFKYTLGKMKISGTVKRLCCAIGFFRNVHGSTPPTELGGGTGIFSAHNLGRSELIKITFPQNRSNKISFQTKH